MLLSREQDAVDGLEEGCFLVRRDRQQRVPVPVRLWFGAPRDPETGEELDRAPRWHVEVGGILWDGQPLDVRGFTVETLDQIWPIARREPTTLADYAFRVDAAEWAEQFAPHEPHAGGRADPMTAPLPW